MFRRVTAFVDGTVSLAEALAKDANADIRLSPVVRAVRQQPDKVVVVHDRGEITGERVLITVPIGVLRDIDFTPSLSAEKLAISNENHAGQGQKVWALARNVPADLSGFGWGTVFDYVGAMHTLPDDLVVLVCFAPEHDRVRRHRPSRRTAGASSVRPTRRGDRDRHARMDPR
jgi:hypothetical protein